MIQNGHVPIKRIVQPEVGALNLCVKCGHSEDDHDFILEDARAPVEMGACLVPGCNCIRFDVERGKE